VKFGRWHVLMALVPIVALCYFMFSYRSGRESLSDRIIVIDAGHGGIDSGANRPGILEKDINLAIALEIRDILKQHGARVILTRDTDRELSGLCDNEKVRGRYRRDLNARVEMIQESDADLFVSIHANACSKPDRRGIECYYSGKSEKGKLLAASIEEQLRVTAPISQEAKPADFFVLSRNKVPAVLVEVGFITNPEEGAKLESPQYQKELAEAIVLGISQYYNSISEGIL